nr:hypothetical protein [uncultured Brevundimonas sp.]
MSETGGIGDSARDAVLNRDCFCITLDRSSLSAAIRAEAGDPDLVGALLASRPNLFSGGPVFISTHDVKAMLDVVAAIEAATGDTAYQEEPISPIPLHPETPFLRSFGRCSVAHAILGLTDIAEPTM